MESGGGFIAPISRSNRGHVLHREVSARFGLLPNFFRTAPAAPDLTEEMWRFARSAYIDSPLPSLFKERLFIHLSRFSEVRYCVVRHVGFLIGEGNPAGDPEARPQSIDEAIALLRRPIPGIESLDQALRRLEAHPGPVEIPVSASRLEADLFDALAAVFLQPLGSARAIGAVRRVVERRRPGGPAGLSRLRPRRAVLG